MDMFIDWLVSFISGLQEDDWLTLAFGLSGFIVSVVALRHSGKANKLAETANALAEKAGVKSECANVLASQANQISRDANAISERALKVSKDYVVYRWSAQFDADRPAIVISNDCPYKAFDVGLLLVRGERELAGGKLAGDIGPFGKSALQSPFFRDYLAESKAVMLEAEAEGAYIDWEQGVRFDLTIYVTWTSELGTRRSHEFKKTFCDADRVDGIDELL